MIGEQFIKYWIRSSYNPLIRTSCQSNQMHYEITNQKQEQYLIREANAMEKYEREYGMTCEASERNGRTAAPWSED